METLLLLIDSVAMVILLYYSRQNDKLKPGERQRGVFRYVEASTAQDAPAPKASPGKRR